MPASANDTTADRTGAAHETGPAGGPGTGPDEGRRGGDEPGVCPFCGEVGTLGERPSGRCSACGAYTDPLSRQATQNEMGPWFIRDRAHPFRPGCRLETIERWVRLGRITADTVLRGPTTHQNWERASRVPGVAHLLGLCHACQRDASPREVICGSCGASLTVERDRQHLGLSPVRVIPGRGDPGEIARTLLEPGRASAEASGPVAPSGFGTGSGSVSGSGSGSGIGDPPRGGASAAGGGSGAERSAARSGRAERRIRQAERRAGVASMLAVLFAALFALSLFMSSGFMPSGGGQDGPRPGEDAGPPDGAEPAGGDDSG